MTDAIPLIRPYKIDDEFHRQEMGFYNLTVLICQRKTKSLIQLCLESLLRFYPDIPIVVMDGQSDDDSLLYLKWMAIKHPNITIQSTTTRSHGLAMHEGIMNYVKTQYVLTLDSDTIIHRGGFIEGMLHRMRNFIGEADPDPERNYAIGTLMKVSRENQGCGEPHNENDILLYAHPSCSIYDVFKYKTLSGFTDHGAPCWRNLAEAADAGYTVRSYPIDKYVLHNCGSSWQEIPTIWEQDFGVYIRPFVTFIPTELMNLPFFRHQTVHDFNIVPLSESRKKRRVSTYDNIGREVNNSLYDIRFVVNGEYICMVDEEPPLSLVEFIVQEAINKKAPEVIIISILTYPDRGKEYRAVRRDYWQKNDCLNRTDI